MAKGPGSEPKFDYTPLRHLVVGDPATGKPDEIVYVVLSRWTFESGVTEFCVEVLDANLNDCDWDASFPTEEEAERHALRESDGRSTEWLPGLPARLDAERRL